MKYDYGETGFEISFLWDNGLEVKWFIISYDYQNQKILWKRISRYQLSWSRISVYIMKRYTQIENIEYSKETMIDFEYIIIFEDIYIE
jgi:hypothetical protein